MELWLIWLIIAATLVIIEVLTQQIVTLCLAIGCISAMLLSLLDIDLVWQLITLAIVSVIAFLLIRPWFVRWHEANLKKSGRDARTGMDALLGRKATVIEEIRPDELGRVRIDGDNWQVRAPHITETIHRGDIVVVTDYDSIILIVQKQ